MANELININGVTKKEKDNTFYYFFGETVIQAYPPALGNYYRLELENGQEVQDVYFDDITDKLGAADIVGYLDEVANLGLFSSSSAIVNGSSSVVPVFVNQSDVTKFFSFRNSSIVIGDAADNIVLFALKKTGQSNVRLKNIVVNIILESKDYVEIQYHKNPTIAGGGFLSFSAIQGSLMSAASGSFSNPSDTLIGTNGNPFEVVGYCEEKNYGKEFELKFSIEIDNTNDQHIFSLVCSGNDTKIKGSVIFEEEIL